MSDSEDDVPLAARKAQEQPKAPAQAKAAPPAGTKRPAPAKAPAKAPARKAAANGRAKSPEPGSEPSSPSADDDDSEADEDGSDSEANSGDSDVPLAAKLKAKSTPASKAGAKSTASNGAAKRKKAASEGDNAPKKRARKSSGGASGSRSRAGSEGPTGKAGQVMWTSLRHSGVLFPPDYVPHGVKMLYDGKPVDLTPDQEEVASMFAVMKDTDYMNKPVFLKNFWDGFKEILGKNHVIKSLDKCDFTPIYEYHMAQREAKKNLSKEEKERIKKEKEASETKYKVAYVDGREEPVGNFRVEPPGLFRGRGEHPKMGMIKKRIYPRDITINIGKGEPVPEHPYPGQSWKEVKHDQSVTWLAYWKDTISSKDYKYVFLGATSTFKADSDLAKYEKARKLKEIIGEVRKNYEKDWDSTDTRRKQMATALYFIDKLALRAGHEKDEDEADTVGCCTLKVENIECVGNNQVKFDFLGKDSIRYENIVEVHKKVFENVEKFRKIDSLGKKKKPGDQLFETFDAQDLNKELKNIMDGLSVKVFRTYNASVVLDRLLYELEEQGTLGKTVDEKKADYDKANKEVAILCNHQRSVPKTHGTQMEKIQDKLKELNAELAELEAAVKANKDKDKADGLQSKVDKKKQQIAKVELQMRVKEDLKTVALGTSKINYMDPRISVAWCKRNEVPIEKVFNKSLLAKFAWAMDVEPEYRF